MKLKIGTEGNHSVLISIVRSKNVIEEGFDHKNNTFVLFLCFFGGPTLNKEVTMATIKGLSMICKLKNLANTNLQKVTKFQGNGWCSFVTHQCL